MKLQTNSTTVLLYVEVHLKVFVGGEEFKCVFGGGVSGFLGEQKGMSMCYKYKGRMAKQSLPLGKKVT